MQGYSPLTFFTLKGEITKNSIRLSALALAAAALAFSTGAFAQGSATDNLSVTASVVSECTISAASGAISFGNYKPLTYASSGLNGNGSVSYTCSSNTVSAVITLGQGSHPTGSSTDAAPARQMSDGTDNLAHSPWSDNGYSLPWGNTSGTGVAASSFDGSAHSVTVYGAVTSGQNFEEGTSSEWVSMTVARNPDILALFFGGPPSVQTKHLLEESSQVGDIYRFRTWDTAGNPVFKSELMTSAGAPIAITGILLHFCLGEI